MPRLACLLASLLLAACLPGLSAHGQTAKEKPPASKPKTKPLALTEKNSGKKITLAKGNTFTVTLESNASTGYSWAVVRINPELLALQGKPAYKAYPAPDGVVGSGGQTTYTFKALDAGSCEVELVYRRSFAPDEKPGGKFTLTVEVKE